MNIHEHQAKNILKEYGLPVSRGVVLFSKNDIDELNLSSNKRFVVKAQIHAGGRGKAGGIKLVNSVDEAKIEAKKMFDKLLVTKQTGPNGKTVNRVYIEESSDIEKEFYLSCLIDRTTSKIAFISSLDGGMDIEEVAEKNPKRIVTKKIELNQSIDDETADKIVEVFNLDKKLKNDAKTILRGMQKIILEKDANLIEINPLILTKSKKLICLDAKMSFDDNALFRRPEILKLRDLTEEDPSEVEASNHNLSFIKLDGSIGCMVNGAGLAMATMDIIKLYGQEPANFLDVGGGATKEQVSAAFKIITSDNKVKGILINIFGGIMRCDVLAEGVIEAAKEINLKVPLVVRLAGTNYEKGKKILEESKLKILPANDLNDAAKKIVEAVK
tara:strand:+ start:866 stop:2023 length:1158 start_codon:yes stop_codon:yes gene_type:complete